MWLQFKRAKNGETVEDLVLLGNLESLPGTAVAAKVVEPAHCVPLKRFIG